jgi:hypothetical protein
MKAAARVPAAVMADVAAATPACIRKCCAAAPVPTVEAAPATLECPPGRSMDLVGLVCVGRPDVGYAPCPAGFKACPFSAWHRPMCVAEGDVFGVDGCMAFEVLSVAHKLPKVACPDSA